MGEGLAAALAAAMAASWFVVVADYALSVALPVVKRRRALPDGGPVLDVSALAAASAAPLALDDDADADDGTTAVNDEQPQYEIDEAADNAADKHEGA